MRWYNVTAKLYDLEHELKYNQANQEVEPVDSTIFLPLYLQEL